MMRSFQFEAAPCRVVFGSGAVSRLHAEAERLALERVLVLSTPPQEAQARQLAASLGTRAAAAFSKAAMHTPVDVTDAAMAVVRQHGIDGIVAIGGGSTIGLGKAVALRTDLPQIVVPTTYAGSEMTALLGETKDGVKTTQSSPRVRPETVIYDPELTLSLPAGVSATSGMNAIAHAVEALYAEDGNPVVALMAEAGVRALFRALPAIVSDPSDPDARSQALYGAWLCGACLGSVSMGLHHKLCHVLGGAFDLPHAETHAILLPHALAFNAPSVPEAISALSRAMEVGDPVRALLDLQEACRVPRSLKALGMPADGVGQATELALSKPYRNPRPIDEASIRGVLNAAYEGAA